METDFRGLFQSMACSQMWGHRNSGSEMLLPPDPSVIISPVLSEGPYHGWCRESVVPSTTGGSCLVVVAVPRHLCCPRRDTWSPGGALAPCCLCSLTILLPREGWSSCGPAAPGDGLTLVRSPRRSWHCALLAVLKG